MRNFRHQVVVGTRTAGVGRSSDSRQQATDGHKGRGSRARRQVVENCARELDFLTLHLASGLVPGTGERDAERSAISGIRRAADQPAIFETPEIPRQCARGDAQSFRQVAETEVSRSQSLQGRGLGGGHAATAQVGPFCERESPDERTDARPKLADLVAADDG